MRVPLVRGSPYITALYEVCVVPHLCCRRIVHGSTAVYGIGSAALSAGRHADCFLERERCEVA